MPHPIRRLVSGAIASVAFGLCAHVHAAPVPVEISSVSFTPGPGYGVDADEKNGTLLDVLFSTSGFSAQSFSLSAVGASQSFLFGTVNLREPNAQSGITENEIDGLGVVANFQFINPFGAPVQLSTVGTVSTGSVSDDAVDLTIDWNSLTYAFGDGGLLEIALADLSFSTQGSLDQFATVTLRALPREPSDPNNVPEPASLALAGLALVGLGAARRRRR